MESGEAVREGADREIRLKKSSPVNLSLTLLSPPPPHPLPLSFQAAAAVRADMEGTFVVHKTLQASPVLMLTHVLYGQVVQKEIFNTPV